MTELGNRRRLAEETAYLAGEPEFPPAEVLIRPFVDALDEVAGWAEQIDALAFMAEMHKFTTPEIVQRAERTHAELSRFVETVAEFAASSVAHSGDDSFNRARRAATELLGVICALPALRHGVRYGQMERMRRTR